MNSTLLVTIYGLGVIIMCFAMLDSAETFRIGITRIIFWPLLLVKELALGLYEEFTG